MFRARPALSAGVAGYRFTEVLSVGERANVFVAVAASGDVPGDGYGHSHGGAQHGSDRVVVKVRIGAPVSSPVARHPVFESADHLPEAEVLAARPISAMPRLIGVVHDDTGGAAIVMSRCPGRPLGASDGVESESSEGRVLREVEAAIGQLHAAGYAHGGLDPGAVLVEGGRLSALVGFSRASAEGAPTFDDARAADLRWLAHLVSSDGHAFSDGEERVGVGSVWQTEWEWREPTAVTSGSGEEPRVAETVEPALAAVAEMVRALRGYPVRGWSRVSPRRRRLFLLGGVLAVLLAVLGAIALAPAGVPVDSASEGTTAPTHLSDPAEEPLNAQSTPVPRASGHAGAVRGDDPVAATLALLRLREGCFAGDDPGCFDGVDQWGSAAMEADLAEFRAADGERRGRDAYSGASSVVVVQRVGDFALMEVAGGLAEPGSSGAGETAAAPLLVVRGGAGWRVRSYGVVGP
ncbi:hypothetical protein [Herbiconiux liukaitaii]|uniref:hypothetical protein n=1 Tax=Herbiconiux liukaitaii TaxID=3342799 RepID=UPI0035B8A4DE